MGKRSLPLFVSASKYALREGRVKTLPYIYVFNQTDFLLKTGMLMARQAMVTAAVMMMAAV